MRGTFQDLMRLHRDAMRTPRDYLAGALAQSRLEKLAPHVDSAPPVVTLPGFGASARTHARLVAYLNHCGYKAQTFEAGFPTEGTIIEFVRKLDATLGQLVRGLADAHGSAVALVGQSAGGLFSREFARLFPQEIDRVITLGAPTADPDKHHLNNRALELLIRRMAGAGGFEEQAGPDGLLHWPHSQPALPYVAICSPVDGAIHEETALVPARTVARSSSRAPRENIRVRCSHFGMSYNPLVILAVADRLGQRGDWWEDFEPRHYFPYLPQRMLRRFFPDPSGGPGGEAETDKCVDKKF